MPIPSQSEMFKHVLEIMTDFNEPEFTRKIAKTIVCKKLGLTEEEKLQLTGSGVPIYESRIGWAISHLTQAGYLVCTKRGVYSVTELGKALLNKKLNASEFISEQRKAVSRGVSDSFIVVDELNPVEKIDSAITEINKQLAEDIMNCIMSIEGRAGDTFFEKIVTDLLEKMGYGKGMVTPASRDGGIDGVIRTDPLGFNPIFIQAKRYSKDNTVSAPAIHSFAGALGAVTRGAFITTSKFSSGAIDFAKSYPHADIILIDGNKLTELMIQYNIGVSTERELLIKKIDNDYFDQ